MIKRGKNESEIVTSKMIEKTMRKIEKVLYFLKFFVSLKLLIERQRVIIVSNNAVPNKSVITGISIANDNFVAVSSPTVKILKIINATQNTTILITKNTIAVIVAPIFGFCTFETSEFSVEGWLEFSVFIEFSSIIHSLL